MKPVLRLVALFLLFLAPQAQAGTSLWRVTDGGRTLYLGGTVHVLAEDDYPLPAAFEYAYRRAGVLVFETDMAAIDGPEFQMRMMQRLSYGPGRSLRDELGERAYGALQAYSERRGLPMAVLDRFRPPMVSLVVVMTELERLGIKGTGVDQYFAARARADGKPTGRLESPEAQLDFIAGMGRGREDALILNSLREAEQVGETMRELKAAWRAGDTAALERIGLEPLRRDYPGLYRDLLVARNQAWMPRLEHLLASPDTELVLVGALHLVGPEGLLSRLRARGYRVVQEQGARVREIPPASVVK